MQRALVHRAIVRSFSLTALAALALGGTPLLAQNAAPRAGRAAKNTEPLPEALTAEGYITPNPVVMNAVLAPRHLNVTLSDPNPTRKYFLHPLGEGLPTVQTFGKPHYYLAGLQVDYRANRNRSLTTRGATGLEIIDATTGQPRALEAPKGATVSAARWSPDGSEVAYVANFDTASFIYVADVASGKSRRVTKAPLLATLVTTVDWTRNGKALVTVLVPENRGAAPTHPAIETGPIVELGVNGAKNKTRTFRDWTLLRDPHERQQFEYYTTGQVAIVDSKTGAVQKIGTPAMISSVDAAPDGQYVRVATIQKPFSAIVQYQSFGTTEQIWDATGKVVAQLAKRPLREGDGGSDDAPAAGPAGPDTAKRNFAWLPNGKGLYYLQQEPAARGSAGAPDSASADEPTQGRGGRGGAGAARKDRLFVWEAPFTAGSAKPVLESNTRIGDVLFSEDGQLVFAAENANGTGTVYAVYLNEPTRRYTITRIRGINATLGGGGRGFGGGGGGRGGGAADSVTFYQNPGTILAKGSRRGGDQVALLSSDGAHAYLTGVQYYRTYADSAPRPFVDRVEIKTGNKERVFFSAPDAYERVVAPLDDDFTKAVVVRESPTMVPDSYLRDMKSGQTTKLTNNKDYTPDITAAIRKQIQVTRADGYKFWVKVTLPRDYKAGTRLPGMFWFYPYEYTDQAGYDRTKRTENKNQFPNINPRSMEILTTQGYAVIEPDTPIFGSPGRMNDNYVQDLRNNLSAVIDELDRQGLIDRQRLGIGGHSYGAFSTVNALVHTPFFKAGIAGDGAYNRTLTPNNFQSERRDLWEARETYLAMSPFLYADRLTGALLMYHNLEDQNVGTDPTNSIRLMHALEGMGKPAALYMYPYEDHGQATKETLLDNWARWTAWLDRYVKNAGKNGETKSAATTSER